MKSEKGITLIALIIYIIMLLIVLGMLNMMNDMFFRNIDYAVDNSKNVAEFNKFNMYFIEDVKNNRQAIVTETTITFEDGTIYTYSGDGIYRNKVKLCNSIEYCTFQTRNEKVRNTDKQIITVQIVIKASKVFETTNDYVLRYW